MSADTRFAEDLPAIAVQSFDLALRHCADCQNFHALWPYLRIARIVSAVESGRSVLEQLLKEEFARGSRTVMLAGAADTGAPALVARAAAGHAMDMTILDRCDTPLELNKVFFQSWSVPIRTIKCDLIDLTIRDSFDVIVAHSVLQMVAPAQRHNVMVRMGHALAPGGRLLHVYNAGQSMNDRMVPAYRQSYGQWVCEQLDRGGMPLPEPRDAFRKRLDAYALERQPREGAFLSADDVDALSEKAGLRPIKRLEVEAHLTSQMAGLASKLSRRRHISVLERK